jgi:glycosyltransferase involved in cell wall biosynthesis
MKILILNWRDVRHPLAGGAEYSLSEHAKYWQKKGAEVIWFSSQFRGGTKEDVIDDIKIIRRGSHYTVHVWAFLYYINKKTEDIDIVVDSFHFIPFFTPLYMRKSKKLALINEVAGDVWFQNLPFVFAAIGNFIEPFFFFLYKKVAFMTASSSTKKELIYHGIPQRNIFIIPHGITVPKTVVTRDKKPVILFLNRISIDKGITDVLSAFYLVQKKIPQVKLWIAGKEEKSGMLQKLLAGKNKKNIAYFGFVSEKKKFSLFRNAKLLIHPSKKEGWGLTVIEAASQGTPTVGYNVAGLRDSIMHKKTGLLTETDPMGLYNAIVALLAKPKMYSTMSKNAVTWSKTFSWEKSTKESWKLINRIV